MKLLFTKSNLIGSKLIRWATEESVSHCAVQIAGYVIHSTFADGVHVTTLNDFLSVNTVVDDLIVPRAHHKSIYQNLLAENGHSYDFLAFAWLGMSLVWKKLSGHLIPGPNRWASRKAFLCTEVITEAVFGEQDSSSTPEALYRRLSIIF